MPSRATEQFATDEGSRDQSTDTRTRMFWVADVANASEALSASGLPTFGSVHPTAPGLFMVAQSVQPSDQVAGLYHVDCEYRGVQGSEQAEVPEDKVGLVTAQASATAVFDDAWRTMPGLVIPAAGNVANNNTTDIGGVRCDISGEPVSFLRRQVTIILSENVTVASFSLAPLMPFVGRRNSVIFQGFAAGSILYTGPRVVREFSTKVVRLEHEFIADEYYHLRQYPYRTAAGVIQLALFGTLLQAEAVFWRQPHPDTADMGQLSTNF